MNIDFFRFKGPGWCIGTWVALFSLVYLNAVVYKKYRNEKEKSTDITSNMFLVSSVSLLVLLIIHHMCSIGMNNAVWAILIIPLIIGNVHMSIKNFKIEIDNVT